MHLLIITLKFIDYYMKFYFYFANRNNNKTTNCKSTLYLVLCFISFRGTKVIINRFQQVHQKPYSGFGTGRRETYKQTMPMWLSSTKKCEKWLVWLKLLSLYLSSMSINSMGILNFKASQIAKHIGISCIFFET